MSNVEIHRRLGERDISAIVELVKAAEAVDQHKALEDHAWIDLVQGGRKGVLGLVAKSHHSESAIAYAQISKGTTNSWAIEYVIHPRVRSNTEIGIQLLQSALDEIKRQGGGHVHTWVAKPSDESDEITKAVGLVKGRELYQLRRPLPIEPELQMEPIPTRPFVIGQDEQKWLKLNNDAFSWHPEQGDWDLATLQNREEQEWFDPHGFLLHEIDGTIAAFCWTKIHSDSEPSIGEIYVIAVDPKLRGRHLGKAMCLAGLDYMSSIGIEMAMLYVESSNTSANRLYENLGFKINHIDRAYVIDVATSSEKSS
ncbi:MAG: mycothiol synthase [Acidimicrobiaceae bacterium]|nr:mycothiol synthase [Acidimicrobiaceae bacterium]